VLPSPTGFTGGRKQIARCTYCLEMEKISGEYCDVTHIKPLSKMYVLQLEVPSSNLGRHIHNSK
jgi:hypothetical protein